MVLMQTKGFYNSLLGTEEQPNEPASLASGQANAMLNDAYEKAWKLLQEISECGNADSGDFGCTACSTVARGF